MSKLKRAYIILLCLFFTMSMCLVSKPNDVYADDVVKSIEIDTGTVTTYNDSTSWFSTSGLETISATLNAFALYVTSSYDSSRSYKKVGSSEVTVQIEGRQNGGEPEVYKTWSATGGTHPNGARYAVTNTYSLTALDNVQIYDQIRLVITIVTSNGGATPNSHWDDGGHSAKNWSSGSTGSAKLTIEMSPNPVFSGNLASGNLTQIENLMIFTHKSL